MFLKILFFNSWWTKRFNSSSISLNTHEGVAKYIYIKEKVYGKISIWPNNEGVEVEFLWKIQVWEKDKKEKKTDNVGPL